MPCRQCGQVPSLKANGAITRSPRLTLETSAPASSTTPMNSWPIGPGLERRVAAVVPEVRAADAGQHDADDRVGRLDDGGVGPVAGVDAVGLDEDRCSHGRQLKRASGRAMGGPVKRGTDRAPPAAAGSGGTVHARLRGPQPTTSPSSSPPGGPGSRPSRPACRPTAQRRVPGLRREEVASLAGVSVDYYKRLERGNAQRRLRRRARGARPRAAARRRRARPPVRPRPRRQPRRPRAAAARRSSASGRPSSASSTDDRARRSCATARARLPRRQPARPRPLRAGVRQPRAAGQQRPLHLPGPRGAGLLPRLGTHRQGPRRAPALQAGRNPYDRELSDLVGELSTRSEEFRTWWAAHNVRYHQTGVKRLHHPVVGELELHYEVMELSADSGLTIAVYSAEPAAARRRPWISSPAGRRRPTEKAKPPMEITRSSLDTARAPKMVHRRRLHRPCRRAGRSPRRFIVHRSI